MHAWPELFFDGAGWVRFEPTPAGRAQDVPSYTIADGTPEEEPERPGRVAAAPTSPRARPTGPPRSSERTAGTEAADGSVTGSTWLPFAGAVLALGLVGAGLLAPPDRARRGAASGDSRPAIPS